jgi:acyl carrier protein
MDKTKQALRQIINENFLFGQGVDDLRDDDSFMEKGVIDSTGVLQLVSTLEREFGITIQEEELVPENFDSINRLAAFLAGKGCVHSQS